MNKTIQYSQPRLILVARGDGARQSDFMVHATDICGRSALPSP